MNVAFRDARPNRCAAAGTARPPGSARIEVVERIRRRGAGLAAADRAERASPRRTRTMTGSGCGTAMSAPPGGKPAIVIVRLRRRRRAGFPVAVRCATVAGRCGSRPSLAASTPPSIWRCGAATSPKTSTPPICAACSRSIATSGPISTALMLFNQPYRWRRRRQSVRAAAAPAARPRTISC